MKITVQHKNISHNTVAKKLAQAIGATEFCWSLDNDLVLMNREKGWAVSIPINNTDKNDPFLLPSFVFEKV